MTRDEKETPGGATPKVTVNIPSGKEFTKEEIDDLLIEVTSNSKVFNVKSADKRLKANNRGTVGLIQTDSKLKKILDRVQFLRLSKIFNLLRHRGV